MSEIRLTGLALGALVLVGAASAAANDLGVAVIVGNKEYSDDRVPEVSYAHNDAEAFKRFVTEKLGFDADNVIDLRDATKSQLETAFGVKGNAQGLLWRYIDPSGGSDVVVFYSGHGVPGKAGRGYLLPADSNPDTAELNGYSIDLLYENLGSLSTQSTTVFLDACFSGGSPRGMLIQFASPVYVEADISGGAGLTVLTAASGAQLASWDEKARHGLFTEHLLEGLYGAADADSNGQVTAREAKLHLDRTMTRAARREFGRVQDAGLHGDESAVLSFSSTGDWGSRPSLGPPPAAFTVLAEPVDAQIRVLNIGPRYRAGMELAAGSYEVEASAPGYVTKTETVAHGSSPTMHRMTLSRPGQPFTIDTEPVEAQVRLVGHAEPYQRGMLLPPGSYRVEASAEGYETATENVAHGTSPTVQEIVLVQILPKAGPRFRDCPTCPEMVTLPAGSYQMGSQQDGPVHEVTIAAPFALGVYEVTVAEFGRFVDETEHSADGCSRYVVTVGDVEYELESGGNWRNPRFEMVERVPGDDHVLYPHSSAEPPTSINSGRHPVTCVSWNDAQAYAAWLSRKTGWKYRLPSESEWEYAARAGTATARYWEEDEADRSHLECHYENGPDASMKEHYPGFHVSSCRDGHIYTAPVGSFVANGWGLHDMLGNVWEWAEDCWNGSYGGAPSDGSVWKQGDCSRRIVRGGSWSIPASAAHRHGSSTGRRVNYNGFRVARDLAP